jgi:hypothetical protein
MMDALLILFGLGGAIALGSAVVTVLSKWLRPVEPSPHQASARSRMPVILNPETIGLGIPLGLGLTSWLLLLAGMAGIPLGRPLSFILAAGSWMAGGIAWRITKRPPERKSGNAEIPASSFTIGCRWLMGLLIANLACQTLLTPQHLWDERAIYGSKAAVLFEDQDLNSKSLTDPLFVQYHPRYPLLLPLAEHHVYALIGRVDDRLAKLVVVMMYSGLLLGFAGVLSRRYGPDSGWGAAVLLGTVPAVSFWEYGFLCAQADAPLACYHGLAVLCAWDALGQLHRGLRFDRLAQAGLLAGLAVFVKDEGIAFALVDTVFLAAVLIWYRQLIALVVTLAGCVAIVVPWFWHRSSLPVTGEMTYFSRLTPAALQMGWATLGWSLRHLLFRMFREAGTWGLHWWGVLLSLVAHPRRALDRAQLFLLFDMAGALCSLLVAGMIAPTTVEEHIGGSSHRFLLQLTPVALLFLVGQWNRAMPGLPEEASTDAAPQKSPRRSQQDTSQRNTPQANRSPANMLPVKPVRPSGSRADARRKK